jgi:hypothetical protein
MYASTCIQSHKTHPLSHIKPSTYLKEKCTLVLLIIGLWNLHKADS